MKNLLDSIITNLAGSQPVMLVSVVASSGSTPRNAGAMMAVFPDGRSVGTIGGGAVEFEAQQQALRMLDSKDSQLNSYTLTSYDVADLGMICGGDVTVYYEHLDPRDERTSLLYKHMRAALDKNENAWIIRRFESGKPAETAIYDGGGLRFAKLIDSAEIAPLLGNAPKLTSGDTRYYTEPLTRAGRAYIFGGGHIAQELAPVLSRVGFRVVIYEDRENFARAELFPEADEIILNDFSKISGSVAIGAADYAIIMTRGHQHDYEVLEQTLRTGALYVGCIGSAKKMEAIKRRLVDGGLPETALSRLFSPIGLKIKAETPAEIAVSVAAELIKFRAENY